MQWHDRGSTVRVTELHVAASLADPREADLFDTRTASCPGQPAVAGSSGDVDRGDDRRLRDLWDGHVLEVQLERLAEIFECALDRLPLAGHLDLEAARYIPRSFVGDRGRESHTGIVDSVNLSRPQIHRSIPRSTAEATGMTSTAVSNPVNYVEVDGHMALLDETGGKPLTGYGSVEHSVAGSDA